VLTKLNWRLDENDRLVRNILLQIPTIFMKNQVSLVPQLKAFSLIVMFATITVACGGGSSGSPTSPSSQFPNVAGTYAGQLSLKIDGQVVENITARLIAVQSGSEVTINSRITIDGVPIDLPAVTGNIDATGFFTVTASGASSAPTYDQTCGYITATATSLNFPYGLSTVQYIEIATTDYCGTWNFSGILTRY